MPEKSYYLGIDVGGTKMLAVMMDDEGNVLGKERQPTQANFGEKHVLSSLLDMVERLISSLGSEGRRSVRGIGIAAAGTLDAKQGIILYAGNLGWRNVPIAAVLAERYRCPVQLINDANAAAFGEWKAGAAQGTDHFVYVTISTGIGGGVVSGGNLLLGASGSAAELGHFTIDWKGPACGCGNQGCLELFASGTAISRRVTQDIREGHSAAEGIANMVQGDFGGVTAKLVSEAALSGDPYAIRVLSDAGSAMGAGLASIIHIFNPERIVYGGGVSESGEAYVTPMLETVARLGMKEMTGNVGIVPSALGAEAGAAGAALRMK